MRPPAGHSPHGCRLASIGPNTRPSPVAPSACWTEHPGPPTQTQAPGPACEPGSRSSRMDPGTRPAPRVQALALLTCRLRCWACPAKDPSSRRTCDHRRTARLEPGFACWSLSVKAIRGAAFANGGHRREATRARSNRDTSRHRRRLTELHRLTRKKRGVHGLSDEERRRTPPR